MENFSALNGRIKDFIHIPGVNLLSRTDDGHLFEGVNFAPQDYLNLPTHPDVLNAAIETIQRFDVHALVRLPSLAIHHYHFKEGMYV